MTDLLSVGTLEPIAPLAYRITGTRPSRPTIWRWLQRGVNGGVKLEGVQTHVGWQTTEQAFRDFLDRRTEAMLQPKETVPAASDDDLRAAGLL